MLRTKIQINNQTKKARGAIASASFVSLGRAGAYIRGIAQKSIKIAPEYSRPGAVPHSRAGQLKRSILFDAEKRTGSVVVGPRASWVSTIGSTHEFGKTETKTKRGIASNWKIKRGGHGPIVGRLLGINRRTGKPEIIGARFAKLNTQAQVARARAVVESFRSGGVYMGVLPDGRAYQELRMARRYPERPFMSKALQVAEKRIPQFWKRSVVG